jgi:DIS3-like exonuclease 1
MEGLVSYYHLILASQSPIRRYADVIVHRQLMECVLETSVSPSPATPSLLHSNSKLLNLCLNLNLKTRESKLAQRVS